MENGIYISDFTLFVCGNEGFKLCLLGGWSAVSRLLIAGSTIFN